MNKKSKRALKRRKEPERSQVACFELTGLAKNGFREYIYTFVGETTPTKGGMIKRIDHGDGQGN